MVNSEGYIPIGGEQLHYLQWGSGTKVLLAFHGYNNEAAIFTDFKSYLGNDYTILSFDLPHHGSSKWTRNVPLTRPDLVTLVNAVKAKYGVDKVSLLGYSMGGRVSLTIMELVPESIDKVLLIAPDGLVPQPLYYFFTKTFIGRKIFTYTMHAPQFFFKITDWLHKKRWTDSARHKFVNYYLGNVKARRFLLQVWPGMKDIIPDRKKLKAAIRKYEIPVAIFMGGHDHIIPPAYGYKFKEGLDSVQIYVVEKGHRVFDQSNAGEMARHLL